MAIWETEAKKRAKRPGPEKENTWNKQNQKLSDSHLW